jgi:hypothetical protein
MHKHAGIHSSSGYLHVKLATYKQNRPRGRFCDVMRNELLQGDRFPRNQLPVDR